MLIIEILLTIFAWRKGWGWKAIIPTASAFGIGVLVGASVVASGGVLSPAIVLVDVAAIIALIVMVSVEPETKPVPLKNEQPKED